MTMAAPLSRLITQFRDEIEGVRAYSDCAADDKSGMYQKMAVSEREHAAMLANAIFEVCDDDAYKCQEGSPEPMRLLSDILTGIRSMVEEELADAGRCLERKRRE